MSNIYSRVSIRRYEDTPVERDKIIEMLRAAMASPSAGNQQPWEFYVVTDREMLDRLSSCSPYAGMLKKAPLAIVTAYREKIPMPEWTLIDMAMSMENMWLEADELGLGGVMLGIAPVDERMKIVEEIVGIPSGQRAFGIFSCGYPAEKKAQQDRFDESRVYFL